MQSPGVKQTAVNMVVDVYSIIITKVLSDLLKHHADKDAEQSRYQKTTLFHAVVDSEGSREVAVKPNLAALIFVRFDNHAENIVG